MNRQSVALFTSFALITATFAKAEPNGLYGTAGAGSPFLGFGTTAGPTTYGGANSLLPGGMRPGMPFQTNQGSSTDQDQSNNLPDQSVCELSDPTTATSPLLQSLKASLVMQANQCPSDYSPATTTALDSFISSYNAPSQRIGTLSTGEQLNCANFQSELSKQYAVAAGATTPNYIILQSGYSSCFQAQYTYTVGGPSAITGYTVTPGCVQNTFAGLLAGASAQCQNLYNTYRRQTNLNALSTFTDGISNGIANGNVDSSGHATRANPQCQTLLHNTVNQTLQLLGTVATIGSSVFGAAGFTMLTSVLQNLFHRPNSMQKLVWENADKDRASANSCLYFTGIKDILNCADFSKDSAMDMSAAVKMVVPAPPPRVSDHHRLTPMRQLLNLSMGKFSRLPL